MPPTQRFAFVREPLVHFLVLGAAIYGLYAIFGGPSEDAPDQRTIHVTAGEIAWMDGSWEKRWNRPPTPAERAGLIQEYVRETVLYREALAMGLDQDDTIVRRRLAQKLEFLSQDLLAPPAPEEAELQAWYAANAERYREPALATFTHVFVDPDKREDRTLADADTILAELRSLPSPGEAPDALGDPFMLQRYYPERSQPQIAKLFGSEFAQEVAGLSVGALLLVGSLGLAAGAGAHEIRPALLDITEREGGWFDVVWKVPTRGDRVLGLEPRLPESLVPVGPPSERVVPGATPPKKK